jgi:hypothetical protein
MQVSSILTYVFWQEIYFGYFSLSKTINHTVKDVSVLHFKLCNMFFWQDIYFGYFSLSKKFNHAIKDASVLHFNLCNSRRLKYFLTYTLQNTPPIATTDQLETINFWHKEIQPTYYITDGRFLTWRDFDIYFELTWHLLQLCPSPFSYNFVHFPNLQCVY